MRFFKIILVFVAIYFIRRFMQMYRVMKRIQEQQMAQAKSQQEQATRPQANPKNVINAEYKVVD
jgi:hypothetical protein